MDGFLGISWWIWAGLAAIVALIFAVFVPNQDTVMATMGLQFFILRYAHSLVWVFLAVSFLMRASQNEMLLNWANPVAALGGICYAVYIITMVST